MFLMGICFALVIVTIGGFFAGMLIEEDSMVGAIILIALIAFIGAVCVLTSTNTIDDKHWLKYHLEKLESCDE